MVSSVLGHLYPLHLMMMLLRCALIKYHTCTCIFMYMYMYIIVLYNLSTLYIICTPHVHYACMLFCPCGIWAWELQISCLYRFVVQKCSFTAYHLCMVQCVYPEISMVGVHYTSYSSFGQWCVCVCVCVLEWLACGSAVSGLSTCTQRPLPR